MQKRSMQSVPRWENPLGLDARMLCDGPAARLMMVKLGPGGVIPAHPAPVVVDFVVLAGAGTANEGGEAISIAHGDIVRFEADTPHGFQAGPEGLTLLAVKHG